LPLSPDNNLLKQVYY